ncbi:MAG: cell division protein FtsL [Wenzhouxiangellaceae bacterium]|nr:cell division protein FtsL [Wenzhouxiangellaceae bacterium]
MKHWIVLLVLLFSIVGTAVALVASKHQGRQMFIAIEQTNQLRDQYQVEWSRLQIELAWLSESGRIERQASENLQMESPSRVGVLVADDG